MCIRDRNDYYQYDKYEKMKMSINDLTPEKLEKGIYKKYSFLKDQVEGKGATRFPPFVAKWEIVELSLWSVIV